MKYFYNGKFLNENEMTKTSPLSDGVMYGYGLFETVKIKNSKPVFLDEHLKRLRDGLTKLNITFIYSDKKIIEIIDKLIKINRFDGALKITVIKNKNMCDLILMMRKSNYLYKDYQKGFNLKISDVKRNSTSKIVGLKTINYLENILEFKNAKNEGFDEILFFNEKNKLCEGAISNIFIVKNKKLYTPSLENGLLSGIMRMKVIKESDLEVIETDIDKEFLESSDEIFLTNSLMEVMPVKTIKGIDYNCRKFEISNYIRSIVNGDD
ncbi:aminotransferase class IV [Clostridiaceae bacterium HSG29]|nr:aminotransferase class IV [Clostridiaceae bacterium HSG29]